MSIKGLTEQQVQERIKRGLDNKTPGKYTKSAGRIIFDNIFTYFNILTVSLFIIVLFAGSVSNSLFIGVVISNAFMGIVQELKSKKLVDRLSIITESKATVIRGGEKIKILVENIVKDDIIIFTAGDQITVDAKVIETGGLEADEALLTGESVPVVKNCGDMLMSGSFVSSGTATAVAVNVGTQSYAAKLSGETKKYKKACSQVTDAVRKIIRYMSYIILPVGILLFVSQHFISGINIKEAVVGTVGGVIGMIPGGLVLISTITLALGVMRCASHKALVQEAAAIEALARVDMLCIDKTGTLTDGSMELKEIIPIAADAEKCKTLFAEVFSAFDHKNSTAEAIINGLGESHDYKSIAQTPFSSERKWCSVTFEKDGRYVAGAPEYLIKDTGAYEIYIEEGYRVIALACGDEEELTPVALAVLSDKIRYDAAEVIEEFIKNDVKIKIISGDNPKAVSVIAKRLGLENAEKYVDMSQYTDEKIYEIADKYEIFGRVTPKQKKIIVEALKKSGHTVAMTGDGVNDVLAMNEADCSVAVASGSEAAKGIAKIVLANSDFSPLVSVVKEGRRVVNNLESVACLYLTKTLYSLILSLFFIFSGEVYPLTPLYLTVIGSLSIGIPSFFLALENNTARIQNSAVSRLQRNALPGGIFIAVAIMGLAMAKSAGFIGESTYILQSVWIAGFTGFAVLLGVSRPVNLFRGTLTAAVTAMFVLVLIIFGGVMGLPEPKTPDFIILPILSAAGLIITLTLMKPKEREQTDGK